MKKYIYTMVFGLMLSACTSSEQSNLIISVLEDTTEVDFIAKPSAESITTQFDLNTYLWRSATFRYGTINSLVHNSRETISLPQENALLGNELERKRIVKEFKQQMHTILERSKDSTIYKHSSIWLPIVEELKALQQQKNSNTQLYVFSDLQENSRFFSVFRMSDLYLLEEKKEELITLFLSKSKDIKPSEAIRVIIVFQPQSIAEDELFQKLKQLYIALFSKLGISIEFKANLN